MKKIKVPRIEFKDYYSKSVKYVKHDVWTIKIDDLPPLKSYFVRISRIIIVAINGFYEDKIQLRSSGLTFYSLLSIVPILAMAFGIAKGFGLEAFLEQQLRHTFEGQEELLKQVLQFTNSYLASTQGGLVAGVSLAVLMWTVFKLLMNIEESFNDIWNVKKSRNISQKFVNYISMMFISPILVIMASSATVFISTYLKTMTTDLHLSIILSPLIFTLIKFTPYILIWALLTIIYIVMPNTKVNFNAAFIAALIAGTAYQLTQWVYIIFQVGVSKFNAVYGSLAALPLLLVWMEISWLIILAGAKIAFTIQNIHKYIVGGNFLSLSLYFQRTLALLISDIIVKNFVAGNNPLTVKELSDKLKIPENYLTAVIENLLKARLIIQVKPLNNGDIAYVPTQDSSFLDVNHILESLDKIGLDDIRISDSPEYKRVKLILDEFYLLMKNSPQNKLVRDI